MKIALCSSHAYFGNDNFLSLLENFKDALHSKGHMVEIINIPFSFNKNIIEQFAAFRLIDLNAAEKIFCFQWPANIMPHPNKIIYIFDKENKFNANYLKLSEPTFPKSIRKMVHIINKHSFEEAQKIFVNTHSLQEKISKLYNIETKILDPLFLNTHDIANNDFAQLHKNYF